jgi:phage tail-like protein
MSNERDKPNSGILATRRHFLRSTARASLAGLMTPALASHWAAAYGATADKRSYVAGRYALELDGAIVGMISAARGGNWVADVVVEKPAAPGGDRIRRKHLAGARVEPISIQVGLPMAPSFYAWLKSSFEPRGPLLRKNGALLVMDFNGKVQVRHEFFNALVTEVEFPACDAASKDPARLDVTFAPQTAALAAPRAPTALPMTQNHRWLSSNFRLNIKGLEAATTRATHVEAIPIKLENVSNPVGELRNYEREPASPDFPNLVVTIEEAHAQPMYDWLQDFVVKGQNGQDRERVGVLEYLAPDMRSVLLAVNFFNLGIFSMEPDVLQAGAENIRRTKVSMYCEAITADFRV